MDRAREYAGTAAPQNEEFVAWLEEVDAIVQDRASVSVFDLEDMLFFDGFTSGESPISFVAETVAPILGENYGEEYAKLLSYEP